MRAFRVERPSSSGLRDLPTPIPRAAELLVRVEAVGICGSDLDLVRGARDPAFCKLPVVPGHEWAGTVVQTSRARPDLLEGTRVAVEGHHFCGHCAPCAAGRTQICESYDEYGFTRDGGYSEYVAARADLCHAMPDVTADVAACTEPTACALHAVERSAVQASDRVVVIGAGPIGLLAAACAASAGARHVLVADLRTETFEAARAVGASDTVAATPDRLGEAILDTGRGAADVVIEAAGHPDAQRTAMQVLARGGRLAVLGIAGTDRLASMNLDPLVFRDARVDAVFAYPSAVFERAARLIDRGRIDPRPLLSHRFPLSRVEDALGLLQNRREPAIKVLLDPRL